MNRPLFVLLALTILIGQSVVHASPQAVNQICQTTDKMSGIIGRDLLELLRAAKRDFQQLKRVTRGNYEAEEILHRFGDTMGTVESISRKLNEQLLPKLHHAANELSSGHGHSGGYGGNTISAREVVELMGKEVSGKKKLAVLRNSIRYVRTFDGQSMLDVVQQIVSSSHQAEACEIVGSQSDIRIDSYQLCAVIEKIVSDSDKLRAAKALARGVTDLNPITLERICRSFISFSNQRKFKEFVQHLMNQY